MSNSLRKIRRHKKEEVIHVVENKQKNRHNVMVHGAMIYECEKCGRRWRMWLEEGLEQGGENHKPVPYIINCKCGGEARHVEWNKDIHLAYLQLLPDGESYFKNDAGRNCGRPVLRFGDI